MPTVTLNKEVFEKLVGKKLKLDELKDRISMLGTDLESIEGNEINVEMFLFSVTLLCIPPTIAETIYKVWRFGDFMCKTTAYFQGKKLFTQV